MGLLSYNIRDNNGLTDKGKIMLKMNSTSPYHSVSHLPRIITEIESYMVNLLRHVLHFQKN